MVPVELRLKNFLSYGTEAPPLDFNQFQVACLSGRNGQGKSALLDAVTWALWGEARKSSGSRKPDDDLIRIGTRHMQVDLVFDIEGERYRVVRSYQRSATGKTTSSDLEFHLYEPSGAGYRPLTGANQRETQAQIDRAVGLDYDTFINSAFLLQGRSDEFTKKRPSQRKEVLTRILNLDRYKKLARRARDCWREAKEAQQLAANHIERLEEQVEDAPVWERAREEVREEVEAMQQRLEALRAEETALTEALADLEAKAREHASLEETLQATEGRIEEHRAEAERLRGRIAQAEALIENADQIRSDYERYESLLKERDVLDEKRDLYRGIEKQIEQQRAKLKDKKNELERRLERLEIERRRDERERGECQAQLANAPALREALRNARHAEKRRTKLAAARERREVLREEKNAARQALEKQHERLKSELEGVERQVAEHERELNGADELQAREARFDEAKQELEALKARRDRMRERGQALAGQINEAQGRLETRREVLADQEDQLTHLRATQDGRCPTCGTELTDDHRQTVTAQLEAEIQALHTELQEGAAALEAREDERAALRSTYADVERQIAEQASVPEALAALRHQLQAQATKREALTQKRDKVCTLRRKIEEKAFGEEARACWKAAREALDALDFDAEAFERVQKEAAQVERYEERLRELEEKAGRKEQLDKRIEQAGAEAKAVRETLDDGSAFGPIQKQIARLEEQLDAVGFDAERVQAVKRQLEALSEAGSRAKDLMNAQQNRTDWAQQLDRERERLRESRESHSAVAGQLKVLQQKLQEREATEAKQAAKAAERQAAEEQLSDLQQRLGELNRRLEEVERDRAELDTRRQELAETKARRHLYKQLRKAFGKHGIPSLIIEQTLPEIEERANSLLERLTDGRMHVRLETLKDKKTGGTKETLEIIITDEQGLPRAYETFSGGEAFRVNFALRIALAQLLAERSGVRIRSLVIDEGFGTQDAEGLENLVDAIQVVRQDFDKIIVITHLEELKARFPVRIEVEKDPVTGSTFELLGA